MKRARVLVVDDSAFARKAIARMLGSDAQLEVVAQAQSGEEALARVAEGAIDVVTLDLEMPGLDGLATLKRLRASSEVPVVILSGATAGNANLALQALDLGAFEVVSKPVGSHLALHGLMAELVATVRAAVGLGLKPAGSGPSTGELSMPRRAPEVELVVIGISTGGPPALQRVIPALPKDFPVPVVVLQHMPPGYTQALAERLDRLSAIAVKEASDGEGLLPGHVYIAPSGMQLGFKKSLQGPRMRVLAECPIPSFYRPCIDFTFMEAARIFPQVLAVVMTGMGQDGASGIVAVKQAGGHVWAQDEASSTIYGMPRAAVETGVVEVVFALDELAGRLAAAIMTERRVSSQAE